MNIQKKIKNKKGIERKMESKKEIKSKERNYLNNKSIVKASIILLLINLIIMGKVLLDLISNITKTQKEMAAANIGMGLANIIICDYIINKTTCHYIPNKKREIK